MAGTPGARARLIEEDRIIEATREAREANVVRTYTYGVEDTKE